MSQTVEFDLKQAVLPNDTFGPREVRQMQEAIARDFSQYAVLRDAVGELQTRGGPYAGQPGAAGRLPVSAGTVLSGDRGPQAGRWRGHGPLLPGQVPFRPAGVPRSRSRTTQAAEKAGYDAGQCALGRAEALRYAGDARRRPDILDSLSGAIEQTAEYLAQRAATVAALGGNPQRGGGALRAGGGSRPQPSRRPVRPGPGERPLRQRRHGHGTVQAGRRPLPGPRRLVDESRPALRGPRPVRKGRPVLPAGAGRLSRPSAGGDCSSRTPRPRTSSTTTRTRRRSATGWARC